MLEQRHPDDDAAVLVLDTVLQSLARASDGVDGSGPRHRDGVPDDPG